MGASSMSPVAHRRALKRKRAGLRGKLTVLKRLISEIQAREKPTTTTLGCSPNRSRPGPGTACAAPRPPSGMHAHQRTKITTWPLRRISLILPSAARRTEPRLRLSVSGLTSTFAVTTLSLPR